MTRSSNRLLRVLSLLLLLVLLAAACGDDDDEETGAGGGDTATTTEAEPDGGAAGDAVEGCEDAGGDASDRSADRKVARCEPGAPAAQRLAAPAKVRLSSAFKAEFVAPVLLAEEYGEFDKENIDFEFVQLGFADALPQIATGQIDVAIGGTEAALFNAVNSGIGVKWAMGNFYPPDAGDVSKPQTGLWVRKDVFSDPADPDLAELKGKKLASAVGLGSSIAYPIGEAFKDVGVDLTDLTVQQIPSPDMVLALKNKAVDAAWLLDPYWIDASKDPNLQLVATQTPGEPIGGLYFGKRLREDEREVGVAFVRAIIRTINTHLAGDYQADPKVLADIAKVTSTTPDAVKSTPSLVFDWEIREGTAERAQEYFIKFGTVQYKEPLPEDDVVDRSLYEDAVGAS